MTSTTLPTLSDRSRLVRLLTELSDNKFGPQDYNLAEQLGRLFNVADSINLARSLSQLPQQASNPNVEAVDVIDRINGVRSDVLSTRQDMLQVIIKSFEHQSSSSGIQAPSVSIGIKAEALQTYEPYQRFYSMHQAELAGSIQSLRQRVRTNVAQFSTELHRLAELDRILSDSISAYTGKLFNVTPKLLEPRFKQLLEIHQQKTGGLNSLEPHHWLLPGGWLELFYRDMQELLLAELDVRLQPIIGLLEALNEHSVNLQA